MYIYIYIYYAYTYIYIYIQNLLLRMSHVFYSEGRGDAVGNPHRAKTHQSVFVLSLSSY